MTDNPWIERDDVPPNLHAFMDMSDEDRARVRRIMSGEVEDWFIRVGDLLDAIRALRTNPCKPSEYQRALADVTRVALRLSGPPA